MCVTPGESEHLRIQERTRENDRLKLQMATLEETNKQLTEQLQKFQDMMNASHAAPTLTSSTSHHHHHNTRQQQQHPSAFLLMMILSAALFIYPSVLPQGNGGADLLTAMPHKMPPAGNSRSLLEAATARLSVCQEGDDFDEELKLENKLVDSTKLKALNVLSDHDYAPPLKRGRYELSLRDDNFCTAGSDDRITPPRKKQRLSTSCVSSPPEEDVVEIKDEALSPSPPLDDFAQISKKAEDEGAVGDVIRAADLGSPASKGGAELGSPASKGSAELGSPANKGPAELLAALGGGASDYWEKLRTVAMSALLGSLVKPHNRTVEPSGAALHDVASQLVVEIKGKRFREDLELE
ncbi:hypothetical protein FHG87_019530 [Trinorchestia longiramus]|nr:hypothetical protein FHG87_019530 [Trinorchestia longiramus]